MRNLGANQKLKSGIFFVLESGICRDRIQKPQRGIQNLILSWITLHGARTCILQSSQIKNNYISKLNRYFRLLITSYNLLSAKKRNYHK